MNNGAENKQISMFLRESEYFSTVLFTGLDSRLILCDIQEVVVETKTTVSK